MVGYFRHSHYTTFEPIDKWVRMRLRSILRKRQKKRGRGRGSDHQRWPNAYFAKLGLYTLKAAHVVASPILSEVKPRLESRTRETRPYGSEGGGAGQPALPTSIVHEVAPRLISGQSTGDISSTCPLRNVARAFCICETQHRDTAVPIALTRHRCRPRPSSPPDPWACLPARSTPCDNPPTGVVGV